MPMHQWLYFDSLECLPTEDAAIDELTQENCAPVIIVSIILDVLIACRARLAHLTAL